MKISSTRAGKPGFISYVLVLSTGLILTLLMLFSYRRAMEAQKLQSTVQLRNDYSEKEDAILRSIVAITPNRAIRAMQSGSNANTATSDPLRWQNIFSEALDLANARTSISSELKTSINITNLRTGNAGDSSLSTPASIFKAIGTETGYVSAGINRSLGSSYPPQLTTGNSTTTTRDPLYPIISLNKVYGSTAQTYLNSATLNGNGTSSYGLPVGTYPIYNRLKYPNINFGYAKPGDPFVAKRNWWAFSMDVAGNDASSTKIARPGRDFVLSIYEIPSQLAISASSFMSLGKFASGDDWQNVNIDGGVFGGKVNVEGVTEFSALASRRGMTLSTDSTIGGQTFINNPFTPGVREAYQLTQGEFFPVSLASESGRVAFVSINRGPDYFDRLAHPAESNVLSPTTWNDYSIGALQCAMRLDITQVVSATNKTPTALRFSYLKNGVRQNLALPLNTGPDAGLPPGYLFAANENQTYNFGTAVVDVAYGKNGTYAIQTGVTGSITYNNARFGDPLVGVLKTGYYKPSYPFEIKTLASGKLCVAIYPQRFKKFLASLNADTTATNNSIVVNVDYTTATGSIMLSKPSIPCTELDYGVVLQECSDLTDFTKGFSLVTNLRTYIGDDFNVEPMAAPSGYTGTGPYYPPCSLFAPEKRYGVDVDPFAINMSGQVGSLVSETAANPVRPLDSKTMTGAALGANRITVNLRPITHPAELPPIAMMNWLVIVEERRKEFVSN
jgi:hypothetical protein